MPVALHKDQEMAAHWKSMVRQVEDEYHSWYERCKAISQRYRDESATGRAKRASIKVAGRRLNLFWSNVQVLKPAIYSKTPVPVCERRFLDKDTTGRVASTILERALRYEVAMSGFDASLRRCRLDYLLVGRGQVWIRYNPKFGEQPVSPPVQASDEIIEEGSGKDLEADKAKATELSTQELLSESLCVDYLHWKDYYQFPAQARIEEEIEGKGRKLYMGRADLIDRFGEKIGKKVPLDHVPKSNPDDGTRAGVSAKDGVQATIYEIWWKPTRTVYFIAKEFDQVLEEIDDPLRLEGFFPCPPCLMATETNDTMIPVPDYVESQDQYQQIDLLTKRIDVLTAALKVVGVYDAAAQSLKRVFEEGVEPNLIPVDSWAMFAEKGGLKGAIDFVPLKDIADTLEKVIQVRAQIIADLDRTTGIWDIMRGTSDARETMGAQRLKQNNGSQRLVDRQEDMAKFCRNIIAIMGELIAEHFDEKTLIQVSGALFDEGLDPPPLDQPANPMLGHNGGPPLEPPVVNQPPASQPPVQPQGVSASPPGAPMPQDAPMMPANVQESSQQKQLRKIMMIQNAIDLLRQDKQRGFRIDIETDSTIQGDAQQEKQDRIAFVEGVTKFVETAAQVSVGVPEFAPLAAKMLMFAVRGFRVGRDLETALEEFGDKAEKQAKDQALNPKPNPEEIKAQAEMAKARGEIQRQQVENEGEKYNADMAYKSKMLDLQMKQIELQMKQAELQIKTHEANMNATPEGGEAKEGSSLVHPHVALAQIADAAKVFDMASKRNAAPKKVRKHADGRGYDIVTDFKE